MTKLAPKEEAFARAMALDGKGPSDAYRATRDCSKMATSTINANAKKLARKPAIKARIEELRRESGVTAEDPIATRAHARAEPEAAGQGSSPMADQIGGDALNGRDPDSGRFLPGNWLWETRTAPAGHPRAFADGEALWTACVPYFEWVRGNPLYEDQLVTFQGMATHEPVAKMRAMTIKELCLFLRISNRTWNEWKQDRPDLVPTITDVEAVIYSWKFAGAAAGLLNANIIARELGLADKQEHMGEGGGPVQVQDLTPQRPDDERLMVLLAPYLGPSPSEAIEAAKALTEPKSAPKGDGAAEA